jgi:hypothetical protein
MRTNDVVLLTGFFGFLVFLTIVSWTYPFQAALFPRLLLGAGFVVCTLELIMKLKHKGQGPARGHRSSEEAPAKESIRESRNRIAIFVACGLSYLFLLPVLGYILTQFLVIGVLFILLGIKWKTTLALAVGTSFGGYLVFAVALQLPLPVGVLERLIF